MKLDVKKLLLAGTAVVAVGAFGATAQAQTVIVDGAPETVAADPNADPAIYFQSDDEATVEDDVDVTGTAGVAVITDVLGEGTLTFDGTSTVTGTVGIGAGGAIGTINAGAAGETVLFEDDVAAQETNITGTGTVTYDGILITDMTFEDAGTVNLNNIMSGSIDFSGESGVVNAGDGVVIDGTVDNDGTAAGTLTFLGSGGVTGAVGATTAIAELNAGEDDSTVNFLSTVDAEDITITGTGTVGFGGDVTGDVEFDDDGTVLLGDNVTLDGAVITNTDGEGTLTLLGNGGVTGTVGTAAEFLAALNATGADATVLFADDVFADQIMAGANGSVVTFGGEVWGDMLTVTGTGTVNVEDDVEAMIHFENNGLVNVADGVTLVEAVTTETDGSGQLVFEGDAWAQTDVGAEGAALASIAGGLDEGYVLFDGDVYANLITIGDGILEFLGDVTGDILFEDDGWLILDAADGILTGSIMATDDAEETLVTISDDYLITGQVGTLANRIDIIDIEDGSEVFFESNVFANDMFLVDASSVVFEADADINQLDFDGTGGTVFLEDGVNFTGNIVDAIGPNTGSVVFEGSSQFTGNIGTDGDAIMGIASVFFEGEEDAAVTVTGDIHAEDITMDSLGSVTVTGDEISGDLFFEADGTFTLGDAMSFSGDIDTDEDGMGHLVFAGDADVEGNIGTTAGNWLNTMTLMGMGNTVTVDGDVLAAGTTILNGNTLDIDGNFTLTEDQTLQTTLFSDTEYGQILVSDAADVETGATLDVAVAGFVSDDTSFMIIDGGAGSTIGTVDITGGGLFLNFTQDTDDTENLVILAERIAAYGDFARTTNAARVAAALEEIGMEGLAEDELAAILARLDAATTEAEVDAILQSVMPTVDRGHFVATQNIVNASMNLTGQRIASLRAGDETSMAAGNITQNLRMWGQVFGQYADQDARSGIPGYDARTWGATIGIDSGTAMPGAVVGAAFTYGDSRVRSDNINDTRTDIDTYQLSLYGSFDIAPQTYVNGLAAYAWNDVDTTRFNVGLGDDTASGSFDAYQFTARAEVGQNLRFNEMVVTPNVMAHWTHYNADTYTETGAGTANLTVDHDNLNVFELGVGVNASWDMAIADGSVVVPEVRAGYRYDLIGDEVQTSSQFVGAPGVTFVTEGFTPARSTFNVGAGVKFQTVANWEFTANYDYEFKSDYDSHAGFIRAGFRF